MTAARYSSTDLSGVSSVRPVTTGRRARGRRQADGAHAGESAACATDESTSVVRQRASIEAWAARNGHEVIGWAEDTDVSGAVPPWQRPELGKWLPSTIGKDVSEVEERRAWEASQAGKWDIACAGKLDRVSRRVLHVWQLVEWTEAKGKALASVEDGFDLSTPMGKILFSLIAAFAEGELEAIRFRAKSSFAHLMRSGRWRGGFVPYGYRAEKDPESDGWKLVPDEYGEATAKVVREIVRRIVEDGDAINAVSVAERGEGSDLA
jgi:DNA invertase Pin-like site-specific DNA recombinase